MMWMAQYLGLLLQYFQPRALIAISSWVEVQPITISNNCYTCRKQQQDNTAGNCLKWTADCFVVMLLL